MHVYSVNNVCKSFVLFNGILHYLKCDLSTFFSLNNAILSQCIWKNTLHQTRLGQYLGVINKKFPLTWGWEDGVLVQERVCLRRHWASWRVSVEVRRRRGGRVICVVLKVHEGLAKVGQRVKRVFQELRGLQSRDGRRHVSGGRRMLLRFQLSAGL